MWVLDAGGGIAVSGEGEGERDAGSGICEGVGGSSRVLLKLKVKDDDGGIMGVGGVRVVTIGLVLPFAFDFGLGFFGRGGVVADSGDGSISETCGRPACGPLRFRIEEKCSQSW